MDKLLGKIVQQAVSGGGSQQQHGGQQQYGGKPNQMDMIGKIVSQVVGGGNSQSQQQQPYGNQGYGTPQQQQYGGGYGAPQQQQYPQNQYGGGYAANPQQQYGPPQPQYGQPQQPQYGQPQQQYGQQQPWHGQPGVPPQQAHDQLPPGWIKSYSQQYQRDFWGTAKIRVAEVPLTCITVNQQTGQSQWTPPVVAHESLPTYQPPAGGMVSGADPFAVQHSFRATGRKKALLIGINYAGTQNALAGCINDAHNLKQFICQNYGYNPSPDSILMLTDDNRSDPRMLPTLRNMLAAFIWLVSNTRPGDELFFSYSGHGGQVPDNDGGKASGMDSTLCPMDFQTAGQIRSDDVHKYLVAGLPEGVKLTVVMDCCHSGTMMELPYTYRPDASGKMSPVDMAKQGMKLAMGAQKLLQGGFSMHKLNDAKRLFADAQGLAAAFGGGQSQTDPSGYKQESFNENSGAPKQVFCLSGCMDAQTSADTSFNGQASGALTYAILNALRDNRQLSYEQLLMQLRGFMSGKFSQIPQLSCGVPVDPNSPFSF
ncbi:UNVERIFIED_CONTAM: hypothetical protein HDU68_009605 [Siphonaria sp. JEL0065]|nr:hypothetical protein HDU68_009605 [Siphonaria sp. JEL0065]